MKIKLNNEVFFKFFASNAFGKESEKLLNSEDRLRARIGAICLGVFTLGIGTLVCHFCLLDRKIVAKSNLVRLKKVYLLSKFSGSDEKKIQLINSFYDASSPISISKLKKNYEILKNPDSGENITDFCKRKRSEIQGPVLAGICLFEVLELLKSESQNKYEQIKTLEERLIDRHNIDFYRQALADDLSENDQVKILIQKVMQSSNKEKDAYLKILYNSCEVTPFFDFVKFKKIYEYAEEVCLEEGIPNYFLVSQPDASLDRKIRILGYTCALITCLKERPLDPKLLFKIIDQRVENMEPLNDQESEFLKKILELTIHWRDVNKIISFLIIKEDSPLYSDDYDRIGCANQVLSSGKIMTFTKAKDASQKEAKILQNWIDGIFKNRGTVNYVPSKISTIIKNLKGLKEKSNREWGSSFSINLKGISPQDKEELFRFLSLPNADLDQITLTHPQVLSFDLKITKIKNRPVTYHQK